MPTSEGPEKGRKRALSSEKVSRFSLDGFLPTRSRIPLPADDDPGTVVGSNSSARRERSRRSRRRLGVLLGRYIVGKLFRNAQGYWTARVRDTQTGKVFRMSSGSTNVREAPAALDEMLKSIEDGQSSTKAVLDAYQDLLNKKTAPEVPPFPPGESKDFESPCWRGVYPVYVEKKRSGCSAKDKKRWLQAEAIYRAANWIHVGETQGRGKLDRYHRYALPIKDVYVYPLQKDFRRKLLALPESG